MGRKANGRPKRSFGFVVDPALRKQGLRLLGTTERRKRIGCDVGGIVGRGMLRAERPIEDHERALEERRCRRQVDLGLQQRSNAPIAWLRSRKVRRPTQK